MFSTQGIVAAEKPVDPHPEFSVQRSTQNRTLSER